MSDHVKEIDVDWCMFHIREAISTLEAHYKDPQAHSFVVRAHKELGQAAISLGLLWKKTNSAQTTPQVMKTQIAREIQAAE